MRAAAGDASSERSRTRASSLKTFEGVTVIPPGELTPASGDHYRVFTPYWRAWRAATKREVLGAPRKLRSPSRLRQGRIPRLADLTREDPVNDLPPGGESRVASSSVGGFGTARGGTSTGR